MIRGKNRVVKQCFWLFLTGTDRMQKYLFILRQTSDFRPTWPLIFIIKCYLKKLTLGLKIYCHTSKLTIEKITSPRQNDNFLRFNSSETYSLRCFYPIL